MYNIAILIPIILFFIFLHVTRLTILNKSTLTNAIEKTLLVAVIVYYTTIDIAHGLVVSSFIILYYSCCCRPPINNLTLRLSEGFAEDNATVDGDQNDTSKVGVTYDGTPNGMEAPPSSGLPHDLQIDSCKGSETSGKKTTKIPKIIIQTWKTKEIPIKYQGLVDSIKFNNRSYEYKFFTDSDIEEFLKNNYPEYYKTSQNLPILIQKIDFFRYIAVYHYGGFYFDLDMTGLYPLDELLQHDCIFPIDEIIQPNMCKAKRFKNFCDNKMFYLLGQYAFAASPKHPFIKLLIDTIHGNLHRYIRNYVPNSEDYVYLTTGPDFVTNLYMNYANKNAIKILNYDKRQYFGKYAKHNYFGTWKL